MCEKKFKFYLSTVDAFTPLKISLQNFLAAKIKAALKRRLNVIVYLNMNEFLYYIYTHSISAKEYRFFNSAHTSQLSTLALFLLIFQVSYPVDMASKNLQSSYAA